MAETLSIREALEALTDDRYHRQKLITWWDQARVASARVLVIGAGALGNEILKLLALTGVGNVLVYDMDHIERSNLSRTVLFRPDDEGSLKAEVAARRMREINPDVCVVGRCANVIHDVGLGVFAWADVVICGLDNRQARVFASSACSRVGRRWVDGAIEGFNGIVRVFDPGTGPCYECTMSATDRQILSERRSCAMLARDVVQRGHVPTTAVAASIVGALQVQEAIKLLHGQPTLDGEGLHIMGLWGEFSRVKYPRREDCPGHETLGDLVRLDSHRSDVVTLGELLDYAEATLDGDGAVSLDLSRDVITSLECIGCGTTEPAGAVLGAITERAARCPTCGEHRVVDFTSSISKDGMVELTRTLADIGVPAYDVVVARRGLDHRVAWLIGGDAEAALGPLAAGPR